MNPLRPAVVPCHHKDTVAALSGHYSCKTAGQSWQAVEIDRPTQSLAIQQLLQLPASRQSTPAKCCSFCSCLSLLYLRLSRSGQATQLPMPLPSPDSSPTRKLKDYLPTEVVEAINQAGIMHDLYLWQVLQKIQHPSLAHLSMTVHFSSNAGARTHLERSW